MSSFDVNRLWRPWIGGLPIALAMMLSLIQGDGLAMLAAFALGGLVIAAYLVATIGNRRARLTVVAVLLIIELGLFVLSRPHGNAIAPPSSDWLGPWLIAAVVVCMVVLPVERIAQARKHRSTPGGSRPPRSAASWRLPTAVTALILASCGIGCGFTIVVFDGDGSWRATPTVAEISPLPPTLRLVSANLCADGGSSGNCTAEYVIAAKDATPPTLIVQRLATQLRKIGWPLTLHNSMYQGCRSVAGLQSYTDHCLWINSDGSPLTEQAKWQPGEVAVYVDNL